MIFNMTGGGASLNFTVKTYLSETELKADNPKENTIGVITTTTMTSWVFSATEPKEPEVGMVWISVGTSSVTEFNAIKNKTLMVYPLSAKQYEGGKWVNKPAYSYQNGEWVEWIMYLYKAGNECTDITGGFYYESRRINSGQAGSGSASLTRNPSNMILRLSPDSGAFGSALCAAKNKIDLTDIKHIVLEYSDRGGHEAFLSVWSNIGAYTEDNIAGQILLSNSSGKVSLDTTALSGEYVVGVFIIANYSTAATITINNIYVEKE